MSTSRSSVIAPHRLPHLSIEELESLEFDPEDVGLPADFYLLRYSRLKGCGCKIPRADLLQLLEKINPTKRRGIGMDSAVIESARYPGFFTVSTCDVFSPNVECPIMAGKVAAANVLSDVYAMGVTHVDSMLMVLAASVDMPNDMRLNVASLMMQGFDDQSKLASIQQIHLSTEEKGASIVYGGQSILGPWPIIGGCAHSLCQSSDIIMPVGAIAGDVLMLTKPLGTQIAVNMKQWSRIQDNGEIDERYIRLSQLSPPFSRKDCLYAYHSAQSYMCTLNLPAARLMHTYNAHAGTDVTGFGILGHAQALVLNQKENVDFVIETLPVIRRMMEVSDISSFSLRIGKSAETSGGLLIALSEDNAKAFMTDILNNYNQQCWIVGKVVEGSRVARLSDNINIIEV